MERLGWTCGVLMLLGTGCAAVPPTPAPAPQAQGDNALVARARDRFRDLSIAEEALFLNAPVGNVARVGDGPPPPECCSAGSTAHREARIAADRITWLCTDAFAKGSVSRLGLSLEGACIQGDLHLEYVDVPFPLRIRSSRICGHIGLTGARLPHLFLQGTLCNGIRANWVHVAGDVHLTEGFESKGPVVFNDARIGGDLALIDGIFDSCDPDKDAISANGSFVGSSLRFSGTRDGEGSIRTRTKIQGGVDLTRATVTNYLRCRDLQFPLSGALTLRSARVGVLGDDETCWPPSPRLDLEGFTYDTLERGDAADVDRRLTWLGHQPRGGFRPQPFEQLAKVYQSSGFDDSARKVSIAKERERAEHLSAFWEWLWYHTLFPLIGYGHRPAQVLPIALGIVVWGTLCFGLGHHLKVVVPTKDNVWVDGPDKTRRLIEGYPAFNAFVYSLDAFTPLIDLNQGTQWTPTINRPAATDASTWFKNAFARLLRWYLWVHILAGWVLSTLLALALTGLVRR